MSEHIPRHATHDDTHTMTSTAAAQTPPFTTPTANTKSQSPIWPNDNEALAPGKDRMKPQRKRKVDKRSPEYLLKSGLAGGLAGCAVRITTVSSQQNRQLTREIAGKDSSRPSRPGQNPLSNLEPQLCQIHRQMERRSHRHARHLRTTRRSRPLPRPLCNTTPYISLRWHQIPGIRASTRSHNTVTSP